MHNLFDDSDREAILRRIEAVSCDAPREWGKMTCAQALAHCSIALEAATGDKPRKQVWIGKILSPFVRKGILGDRPFSKNSPTDPTFVVTDEKDFEAERRRLIQIIRRFSELGREKVGEQTHSFLGALTGEEWGRMMYKHLDHHLRQFGA